MAKEIYLSEAECNRLIAMLKLKLQKGRSLETINLNSKASRDKRKATISFSTSAWIKMQALITHFNTEVQWHGLVYRISQTEFLVYDILVPPHTVTATSVESDQEEYEEWINNIEDSTFNNLKFHGHSHVDMDVNASSVDVEYRKKIVSQMSIPSENEDEFYIFLIANKQGKNSAEIYDYKYNAAYSTDYGEIDIDVMLDDGTNLQEFVDDAKKTAKEKNIEFFCDEIKSINNKGGWLSTYGLD